MPNTPPSSKPTVLPFNGVPPQPNAANYAPPPPTNENVAKQPANPTTPKPSLLRRWKRTVLSSAASHSPPSESQPEVQPDPEQAKREQQEVEEKYNQHFLNVVSGVPGAHHELTGEAAERVKRNENFLHQAFGISIESDDKPDGASPKTLPQSDDAAPSPTLSQPPADPHMQIQDQQSSQPHPDLNSQAHESQPSQLQPQPYLQPQPQAPSESASQLAEMFGNQAYGGKTNTVSFSQSFGVHMPPPQSAPQHDQARPQARPIGWGGVAESMVMGAMPIDRQPLPHQLPHALGLADLDPNLAWRIGRGRDLGLRGVELEEAGNLGDAEAVYLEALSLMVPASRELDHGPDSTRQMRMRQKARVQREAAAMLDRCEEIKAFLKANAPDVPREMPVMPGTTSSTQRSVGPVAQHAQPNIPTNTSNTRSLQPSSIIPPPPPAAPSGLDDVLVTRLENRRSILPGALGDMIGGEKKSQVEDQPMIHGQKNSRIENQPMIGGGKKSLIETIPNITPSSLPTPPLTPMQSDYVKRPVVAPDPFSRPSALTPLSKVATKSIDSTGGSAGKGAFLRRCSNRASSVGDGTPMAQIQRLSIQQEKNDFGHPPPGLPSLPPAINLGSVDVTRSQSAELNQELMGQPPSMSMALIEFQTDKFHRDSVYDTFEGGFQKMSRYNGPNDVNGYWAQRCVICSDYAKLRAPCGDGFCTKCANQSVSVFVTCPVKNCQQVLSFDTFEHIL